MGNGEVAEARKLEEGPATQEQANVLSHRGPVYDSDDRKLDKVTINEKCYEVAIERNRGRFQRTGNARKFTLWMRKNFPSSLDEDSGLRITQLPPRSCNNSKISRSGKMFQGRRRNTHVEIVKVDYNLQHS